MASSKVIAHVRLLYFLVDIFNQLVSCELELMFKHQKPS